MSDMVPSLITQSDAPSICAWILAEGHQYRKHTQVKARVADKIEHITTTTSTGVETTNSAYPNDYIVQNMTDAHEMYVINPDTFIEKYKLLENLDDLWSLYAPTSTIFAIKLTTKVLKDKKWPTTFTIKAAWGTDMVCYQGDYLASPRDGSEFYRIDEKEFDETYQLIIT